MPSRLITAAALALISFSTGAAAVSCGVCAPTIVYAGLNRTLTLQREEGSNTVQCNYDTPAISGFSPGCLYRNVDGVVIFTNTGPTLTSLPGACPATIPRVTKTVC
ncbi:hypothetical protein B0H14DRAFT_3867046 [Mycena olivaceomarginata]|nr:hypothetical protein B0H14DRAFT_3867046 [Mycena olivaceomarginata]